MSKTLRDLLDPRYGTPQLEGTNLSVEEILRLPIEGGIYHWATKLQASETTWPISGVSAPSTQRGDLWEFYEYSALSEGLILVLYTTYEPVRSYKIRVYPRASAAEYWPSEEACKKLLPVWIDRLYACMSAYVGQDCNEFGPNVNPAGHWQGAKRRYELKGNQLIRLAFLTEVDPEGRWRCLGYEERTQLLPEYIERYLRYADFLCGVRAGVKMEEITADDLYSSGARIDSEAMLEWCLEQGATL